MRSDWLASSDIRLRGQNYTYISWLEHSWYSHHRRSVTGPWQGTATPTCLTEHNADMVDLRGPRLTRPLPDVVELRGRRLTCPLLKTLWRVCLCGRPLYLFCGPFYPRRGVPLTCLNRVKLFICTYMYIMCIKLVVLVEECLSCLSSFSWVLFRLRWI